MHKRIITLAAGALLLAALPAWAQSAGNADARNSARMARDYCSTNTGQRDPHCVVADTGSSTYRDNDAAGWIGISAGEAARSPR